MDEIKNFHNYAFSLSSAYCSCLERLGKDEKPCLGSVETRLEAIAYEDTIKELEREFDVVAHSHRYGGWTRRRWDFNDDIKFFIDTNFGYGCSSYFHESIYFKDLPLTPYTDYIKYRYADFSDLNSYTYCYLIQHQSWEKATKDALDFYNAIVYQNEGYIFGWLIKHLDAMTSGIEELRNAKIFTFGYRYNTSVDVVSGDELVKVKAKKIANALDFTDNIKALPVQIKPIRYVNRILDVCQDYMPELVALIAKSQAEKQKIEKELDLLKSTPDYALYDRIYDKFYSKRKWREKKTDMLRYLLRLNRLSHSNLSRSEIHARVKALKDLLKKKTEIERELYKVKDLLNLLTSSLDKIQEHLKQEMRIAA